MSEQSFRQRPPSASHVPVSQVAGAHDGTGRRAWLVGPVVDLVFVFGIGGLFSAALYACWRAGSGFLVLAALFAVLLDFPHVLWTSLRVLLDPRERAHHGRHYAISLAVIIVGVATLAAVGRFDVVLTVFVVWQVLHVVRQHIGMVSVYAGKARYVGSRGPVKSLLYLGCLAPVSYRLARGLHLGHYVIAGHALPFSDLRLPIPLVPWPVVFTMYAGFAAALVVFATDQWRRRAAGILPGAALATVGVAIVFYNLSYVLVSDPYALILIATTFHSLQYHVISWARNRGRFGGPAPDATNARTGRQLLLARLTCPKSVVPLGIVLALVGAALADGELVLAGVVPFSLVLHHFYLDGWLWKPATNPGLADDLALSARPSCPAPANGR